MDKREYVNDPEETLRTVFAGMMRDLHFAMPCVMSEDTKDGHRCVPQPSIQRSVTDPVTGDVSYAEHPIAPDTVIHYAGGGRVVATHPVKAKDEGLVVYADRALDVPMQQGGTGQPIDSRQHHAGDGTYIPGIRSDPKKLAQVDSDAHHVRSVDKKTVSAVHPDDGVTHKSVDPSTPAASDSFDPFTQASRFFQHDLHPSNGILGRAVDGGTTHDHGVTHSDGPFMRVANALHSVLCHPSNGASLNAQNLLHSVLAHPSLGALLSAANGAHTVKATPGGVQIASSSGVSISCPPGTLSLPKGGVSGGAVQGGGDISGTLDQAKVVSLAHVVGQDQALVQVASDAAAASAGVAVGGLYINTAVKAGVGVLAVRLA